MTEQRLAFEDTNRRTALEKRIYGFDLLRGLCAIAVAGYHMLMWTEAAHFHSWGLFGVYIFFVLSGASMVVAYRDRFAKGFDAGTFLLLRFSRLAPLFLLALLANIKNREEFGSGILNLSFLFGLGNPGSTSWVVGGWSLGIEFAFYLMFPVLLSLAIGRGRITVGIALVVAQLTFIHLILRDKDLTSAWITYTQPLSFIAYFYLGCVIGCLMLEEKTARFNALPLMLIFAGIMLGSAPTATETLTGGRGIALFCMSVLATYFAGGLALKGKWQTIATFIGDASYGVYLLHPFAFALVKKAGLGPLATIPLALLISMVAAHFTLRMYEGPIRSWVKRKLGSQGLSRPPIERNIRTVSDSSRDV